MMETPLVTVVLPLKYYVKAFMNAAVQSIVDQSDPNWRMVIVVEPADQEKFRSLLEAPLGDARIALITNQRRGFAGAINSGVAHAETPFAAILLGDDMWAENAVAVLNREIRENPGVDFFHSSRRFIDEKNEPISKVYESRDSFKMSDFKWGSPAKHLLCWRKSKWAEIGGIDETVLKASDDYDFPWSMAENGAVFKAVKECLYLYRNHCDGERFTTHRPLSTSKRGIKGILKKHGIGLIERNWIIWKLRSGGSLGTQSIYRNAFDRWIKEKIGYDASGKWQQQEYQQ